MNEFAQIFDVQCQICFKEYQVNENIPLLICKNAHFACNLCVDQIASCNQYQFDCPFCKQKIQFAVRFPQVLKFKKLISKYIENQQFQNNHFKTTLETQQAHFTEKYQKLIRDSKTNQVNCKQTIKKIEENYQKQIKWLSKYHQKLYQQQIQQNEALSNLLAQQKTNNQKMRRQINALTSKTIQSQQYKYELEECLRTANHKFKNQTQKVHSLQQEKLQLIEKISNLNNLVQKMQQQFKVRQSQQNVLKQSKNHTPSELNKSKNQLSLQKHKKLERKQSLMYQSHSKTNERTKKIEGLY